LRCHSIETSPSCLAYGLPGGLMELVGWEDMGLTMPNDRTERRGRPKASELATDVARPRSLQ